MIICLGTTNKSKILGAELAIRRLFINYELRYYEVNSGVPQQPLGFEAIFTGARNRALNALSMDVECGLGVGVEAGIYEVNNNYFDVHVAAVADKDKWVTYGLSPSFPLPPSFVNYIIKGEVRELEEVVDRYFKTRDIGGKGGLIRLLTGSRILREDLTYYAVLMAFIPRINRDLYK